MYSELISSKAISQLKFKLHPYYELCKAVHWETTIFIFLSPFLAIYGLATTPFVWQTWLFTIFLFTQGLMGMTTVYHRMYSHKACHIARPFELYWLFFATTDFSMSALDWARDHRAHHKYTDTEKDPYDISKGFWYAHVGWLIWNRERPNSDISDLEKDPVLQFQHDYFNALALFSGWFLPTVMCGYFFNDYYGGFFIASVVKTVALHHTIFCINSVAHSFGSGPFNDSITPRENLILAVLTMGEGYHNFHHEFPNDYRNGYHLLAWDPTKWAIALLEKIGMASDLKRTPDEVVRLSQIQMIQRQLAREKEGIFTGKPIEELPFYSKTQVAEMCSKGERLVVEGDLVYDVKGFMPLHPGGSSYLKNNIGKDISSPFNGGIYTHSNAAKNVLQTLRCGRLLKHD